MVLGKRGAIVTCSNCVDLARVTGMLRELVEAWDAYLPTDEEPGNWLRFLRAIEAQKTYLASLPNTNEPTLQPPADFEALLETVRELNISMCDIDISTSTPQQLERCRLAINASRAIVVRIDAAHAALKARSL